mgnify:CR=1 FL=1
MNLKDLTDEVNSALDYNPDLEAYKSQVARVINRHYLQISSQYNWLFRQKRVPLTLRKDITGDATTNKIQVGHPDTYWASNILTFIGTADTLPTREMLGNTIVINDNDTYTSRTSKSHGASEREFTITGIFDLFNINSQYGANGVYGGADSDEWPDGYKPDDFSGVVIDRPIIDPSTVNDAETAVDTKDYYTDWKIEFRQYYLPSDCVEVLGIVDRGLKTPVHSQSSGSITTSVNTAPDRGRLIFIDAAKEEHLYLDRDSTGDPVIGIEGMPVHLDPPMYPPGRGLSGLKPYNDGHSIYKHGRLQPGKTYEWCYTFVYAGIESAPSPIYRETMPIDSSVGYSIQLRNQSVEGDFPRSGSYGRADDATTGRGRLYPHSDGTDDMDTQFRMNGRIKRWYRRSIDNELPSMVQGYQRWIHIGDQFNDGKVWDIGRKQGDFGDLRAGESHSSFPDDVESSDSVLGFPSSQYLEQGRWTYHDGELSKVKVLDESGPRQTIRVYRPPSQDMDVEIRYLARPKRLVADSDVPEWPVQYHHLLVYMTLADICLQHGMSSQSQLYERKSIELLDRMKQKYLSRTNRKYIRRGFDRVVFAGERFGVPTKV